jgi:hypothetical protein
MNFLRLLKLYQDKMKKKLGRDFLFQDEEFICSAKAKKLNVWLYHRKFGKY